MSGPDVKGTPLPERTAPEGRVEEARLIPGPGGELGVVAAVAKVVADMPGIAKAMQERRQGGDDQGVKYPFRGIDAIAAEARPLFAAQGVLVVPGVEVLDRGQSPGWKESWTDFLIRVRWMIVHTDGSQIRATTYGVGRDNVDKGTNKAQTQAFKYLLMHLLLISDPKDDPDEHSYDGEGQAQGGDWRASEAERAGLRERIDALPEGLRDDLRQAWAAEGSELRGWLLKGDEAKWLPARLYGAAVRLVEAHEARARTAGVLQAPAAAPAAAQPAQEEAQPAPEDQPAEPSWAHTLNAVAQLTATLMEDFARSGGPKPALQAYVQGMHHSKVNGVLADSAPADDLPWPDGVDREWTNAPIQLRRMAVSCAFIEARRGGHRHALDEVPG